MNADRVRPCLHERVDHEHGTRLAYALDRCRCLPCSAANSAYENSRARAKAYGRPTTTWVAAEPVRAHVRRLQAAGLGWQEIGRRAGVHGNVVSRLLYGRKRDAGRHEPPTRRMKPEAAAAILAVPVPDVDGLPGGVRVDPTGTARRLQALVAVGWPQSALAARLGIERGNFTTLPHGTRRVTAATARAVRDLYDLLWDTPAPHGRGRTRAVNYAEARGWAPPLAWDDDTIDDPAAAPQSDPGGLDLVDELAVTAVMDGHSMPLTGATLLAAVHRMHAAGYPIPVIADRCRIHVRQVDRLRLRDTAPRPKKGSAA